jgi:hypothetical protein
MANKKGFVRYANNKLVAGSLILADKAPKVGVWKEIAYNLCCEQSVCSNVYIQLELQYTTEECGGGELDFYKIYACDGNLTIKTTDDQPVPDGYYYGSGLAGIVENSIIVAFSPPC